MPKSMMSEKIMTMQPTTRLMMMMPLLSNLPRTLSTSHVRPTHHAHIADGHLNRTRWHYKSKLCEEEDEKEHDKRIEHGHDKGSHTVVQKRAFARTRALLVNLLRGV